MEQTAKDPEPQVFVVRFWRVAGTGGDWRGQVQHVPSATRAPVRDLAELQAFVQYNLQKAEAEEEDGSSPGLK